MPLTRQFWVILHRWAGLTIALFLIVAGATGIILPWQEELTLASRPALSEAVPMMPGARPLAPADLADRVERQTGGQVSFLPLDIAPDRVVCLSVAASSGASPLGYDTVWADPYTGKIRLAFRYGILADGAQNIVPFIYSLHYGLAAGEWGIWAFGVAALVWTLDCFVGFYLTLPIRRRAIIAVGPRQKTWWSHWRSAWTVRKGGRGHKLNFDLHRAGGLWLWPLLLVFAWSSVGFNLPSVHRPVMKAFGGTDFYTPAPLPKPLASPAIDRRAAIVTGGRLLEKVAAQDGFRIVRPTYLYYDASSAAYRYSARTSLDRSYEDGRSTIWFDGRNGRLLSFDPPMGRSRADVVMNWAYLLHTGQVFGLPYRIFVSLLGLAVVMLSVTGVLVWMKKRSARLIAERK